MKIEELSIGDWVCAKLAKWESDDADMTPPLQVKRIDGTERHNLYVDLFNPANNTIEHSAFVEDLIPIPLTPEILEKNGLMRVSEEKGYEAYCCNDFLIRRSKFSCTDWWQVDVHYKQYVAHLSGYIQYVHQLQHLLTINECDKKIEL